MLNFSDLFLGQSPQRDRPKKSQVTVTFIAVIALSLGITPLAIVIGIT